MQSADSYPESFDCPITGTMMVDPVMDPEGNSYERKAILDWLQRKQTSPITRKPLREEDLITNRSLRDAIEQFKKGQSSVISNINNSSNNSHVGILGKDPTNIGDIDMNISIDACTNGEYTLITIKSPDNSMCTATDICCVIDVSGSMGTEAVIKTSLGEEGFNLSLLDIVKHAVKTIIRSLKEYDRLALVTYSTYAKVVLNLTYMDSLGKKQAEEALEKMVPDSQTNLWDGLEKGLEVLRLGGSRTNSSIFLLTDGQPNVVPPRGHLPMLKRYRDQHGSYPGIINTFGFGYNLDSKLLDELAVEGNGTYAFIPDGSFVGTIFVNALSNLVTNIAINVSLNIELDKNQINDLTLVKNYNHEITSWGLKLYLGSVTIGQGKHFVLPITYLKNKKLDILLQYDNALTGEPVILPSQYTVRDIYDNSIDVQRYRLSFVDLISQINNLMSKGSIDESISLVEGFTNQIKSSNTINDKLISGLVKDLEDQVHQAVSRMDWYMKWGKHYLPSLSRAHLLEQCNNFKDPGVQNYGGEFFTTIRNAIDDIFVKLPPPKPSTRSNYSMNTMPISMSVFNNSSGPCFDGNCTILMADGSLKFVKDIKRGDKVVSNGYVATVRCIVKTICNNGKGYLACFDKGLRITPWHPVRISGQFEYPHNLTEVYEQECPAVYSFLLDKGHTIFINDIECVTLAHGFEDPVAKHNYFGTISVVNDLQKMQGWNEGLIELKEGCVQRDPTTGLIIKLVQ